MIANSAVECLVVVISGTGAGAVALVLRGRCWGKCGAAECRVARHPICLHLALARTLIGQGSVMLWGRTVDHIVISGVCGRWGVICVADPGKLHLALLHEPARR